MHGIHSAEGLASGGEPGPWLRFAVDGSGVALVVAIIVAWRVCSVPFRSAWPRWIPLAVVAAGVALGFRVALEGFFLVLAPALLVGAAVAIAWAVTVGLTSPASLGLASADA